ncbi:MAG: hypothetical protein ABIE22_01690 [archaeon]
MVKKKAKKRGVKKKKRVSKRRSHPKVRTEKIIQKTDDKTLELLAENFLSLQKAMTNMAVKFDSLADQMSKLLNLFEISAKDFVERQGKVGRTDKELATKINSLMDQNKTIAKGLHVMGERIKIHPHIPAPPINQPISPDTKIPMTQEIGQEKKPRPLPEY